MYRNHNDRIVRLAPFLISAWVLFIYYKNLSFQSLGEYADETIQLGAGCRPGCFHQRLKQNGSMMFLIGNAS